MHTLKCAIYCMSITPHQSWGKKINKGKKKINANLIKPVKEKG